MEVRVPSAVAADPRGQAGTPAGHPGPGDGVAHGPIGQPPDVAPVEAFLPGLEELSQGGQGGALLLTGLLGSQEAQAVATTRVLVGKHHPWVEKGLQVEPYLHSYAPTRSRTLK